MPTGAAQLAGCPYGHVSSVRVWKSSGCQVSSASMVEDTPILPAKLLKVVRVEEDENAIHARHSDGTYFWFTLNNGPLPASGDVIYLSANRWDPAPHQLWPDPKNSFAIVRHVTADSRVLVDDTLGIREVANPDGLILAQNNTVELSDDKIIRIISEAAIRPRDFGNEAVDINKEFRIDTSAGGPRFDDFGGYPDVVARARQLIDTQMLRRVELEKIGARPVKGVLFTGPPGTGKTHLARIIAQESGAAFFLISGPTIVSKWVGDSEDTLRRIFETATEHCHERAIIFFDEIDSIAERRGGDTHEASRRLVAQLLTLMDGFDKKGSNTVVIAATNRADALDPALMRPGRFDWEIEFGMPTLDDRYHILRVGARRVQTCGEMPFEDLAFLTEGWSAAALSSIWVEAGLLAAAERRSAITPEDAAQAFERTASRPRRNSESLSL
jgi:transitional endoplasmic reticulum ATPase